MGENEAQSNKQLKTGKKKDQSFPEDKWPPAAIASCKTSGTFSN
ncbi:hypothetical protein [Akkermansia sp. BIOML-A8]|nr:hypothetical protein [Akkermansia sp. BIOML-A8]